MDDNIPPRRFETSLSKLSGSRTIPPADTRHRTLPEEVTRRWYWYVRHVAPLEGLGPELAHERWTNPGL